ncbi:MAG: PqqD family protein [candidate division KSB1 bacterium]|nr:PqqD family protein [candidate division KSB1 bacterium]MDZ7318613.1 PqqD family protein [candidate division KSB1 bacterium]MDZ7339907.1 PqqD family protein [candidate division KSB1 bacterium]
MSQSTTNLFDLIPIVTVQSETVSDGSIVVLQPKFRHPLLVKYLLPKLKKPYFRIALDRFGSFVWQQCNGSQTVKQIVKLFKENFPADAAMADERVAIFMQRLQRLQLLEFRSG